MKKDKNIFFKETKIYKEYMLLDLIQKNKNITQRELSSKINAAVSVVNVYIDKCVNNSYLIKEAITSKNIKYIITSKGIERKKVLNIGFLNATQKLYKEAKENVMLFLNEIYSKGLSNIILYGAGEVAEIFLQTINEDNTLPLNVVGVIDDDINKQGKKIINTLIFSKEDIKEIKHDAILIASYTNHKAILNKLKEINYPKEKIMHFFE